MATEKHTTVAIVTAILNETSLRSILEAAAHLWLEPRRRLIELASKNIPLFQYVGQAALDRSHAREMLIDSGESWASIKDALVTVCRQRADEYAMYNQSSLANSWLYLADKIGNDCG